MSNGKNFTTEGTKNVSLMRLSIFMLFAGLFIFCGGAAYTFAQPGNDYEEVWQPAARFAVQQGGKKEKATITLVKVEKADFETGDPKGITFEICLAVDVQKGKKKAVRQYAQTTVFRDDKIDDESKIYSVKKWKLFKTLPAKCQSSN
jgi:hypothetical protein